MAVTSLQINLLSAQNYTMPSEELLHEGTWLQWPHQYEYGVTYRNRLDETWVAMTQALIEGEKVHIIAYNASEQTRITNLLTAVSVPMTNIDFYIFDLSPIYGIFLTYSYRSFIYLFLCLISL